MNRRNQHLSMLTLAAVLLISIATVAGATDGALIPSQTTPEIVPELNAAPAEVPASLDPAAIDSEKTFVVDPPDDCGLACLQQFTACRLAARGSGGPNFPLQAYEACVDEHEACVMECGCT